MEEFSTSLSMRNVLEIGIKPIKNLYSFLSVQGSVAPWHHCWRPPDPLRSRRHSPLLGRVDPNQKLQVGARLTYTHSACANIYTLWIGVWISCRKYVSPGLVENRFGPIFSTSKSSWAIHFLPKPFFHEWKMHPARHFVVLPCCFQNSGFWKILAQDFAFCRAPFGLSLHICSPGCRIL